MRGSSPDGTLAARGHPRRYSTYIDGISNGCLSNGCLRAGQTRQLCGQDPSYIKIAPFHAMVYDLRSGEGGVIAETSSALGD
jgi:hypothetical protein